MRKIQAEHTVQLSSMQDQVSRLTGKLEELEYGQRSRFSGAPSSVPGAISPAPGELIVLPSNQLQPPPPIVPVQALEQDEASVRGATEEAPRRFAEGLAKVRQGRFEDAIPLLQEAVNLSYGSDGSAHALFWLGVAGDGLGDNKRALAAYSELVTKFPKSKRTPLALLRQASVFIRLNDSRTAKLTLQKLIAEFPKSAEAQQAKTKLKDLR